MRKTDREIAKLTQQYSHVNRQEQLDFLASLDDLDTLLDTAPSKPSEQQDDPPSRKVTQSVSCSLPSFLSESTGLEMVFQSTGTMLDNIFLEKHVLKAALESDALLLWSFKTSTQFPDHLMQQLFLIAASDKDLLLAQAASKSFAKFYEATLSAWVPGIEDVKRILNSFQGARLFDHETAKGHAPPTVRFTWHSSMLFRNFCGGILVALKHAKGVDQELSRELLRVFLLLSSDRFVNEVSGVYTN